MQNFCLMYLKHIPEVVQSKCKLLWLGIVNAKNINMEFCNYHKKRAKHLNNTVVTVESKEWKITLKQIQIIQNKNIRKENRILILVK